MGGGCYRNRSSILLLFFLFNPFLNKHRTLYVVAPWLELKGRGDKAQG